MNISTKTSVNIIFLLLCFNPQPAKAELAADQIALTTGELIIPHRFHPQTGKVNLVFHIHCAPSAAGRALLRSNVNAVMIGVHLGSFSSPYQNYFSNPDRFHELLDQSMQILKKRYPKSQLKWGHICVTAFSGGYGGAREFMNCKEIYDQIDSLILLDCPHTSYTEDRKVYPPQMEGFLRLAKDAIAGKKSFIMTHSEIVPGDYASTTECADYLIAQCNGKREPWTGTNEMGMIRASKFEAGQFKILGYKGDTGSEHMKHLHGMFLFLNQIKFE